MTTLAQLEADILRQSWWLRRFPKRSKRVVRTAVIEMYYSTPGSSKTIAKRTRAGVRYRFGWKAKAFPWILLISIVVRLLIEWWSRRHEAEKYQELLALSDEATAEKTP